MMNNEDENVMMFPVPETFERDEDESYEEERQARIDDNGLTAALIDIARPLETEFCIVDKDGEEHYITASSIGVAEQYAIERGIKPAQLTRKKQPSMEDAFEDYFVNINHNNTLRRQVSDAWLAGADYIIKKLSHGETK
jgi:hypothetical protein